MVSLTGLRPFALFSLVPQPVFTNLRGIEQRLDQKPGIHLTFGSMTFAQAEAPERPPTPTVESSAFSFTPFLP